MTKIDFEFETQYGVFRDAIHVPEGVVLSESDLDSLKLERLNNWVAAITTPADVPSTDIPEYIEVDGVKYVRAQNG